jgi:hypothetical protein
MIKIVPLGGLCNRMRSMDSAIQLVNKLSDKLEVYWIKDSEMSQSFSDLFNPIALNNVSIRELDSTPILLQKGNVRNLFVPTLINNMLSRPYFDESSTDKLRAFDFAMLEPNRQAIIRSFSRFYSTAGTYELFVPNDDVFHNIEARSSVFDQFTIGVHIRRTDNLKSTNNSPNNLFVEAMKAEIVEEPLTNFYLATDCDKTKLFFFDIFGSKIVHSPKTATRDSLDGIREAMVELYSLSRTKKIFGSYWSSFSSTASDIGKIEGKVVTSNME